MEYLTQSALAQSPAAAGLDLTSEIIVCTPYSDIAEYQGTRAALEAEGVIPAGNQWPNGFGSLHWEDDRFEYWLKRERPEGTKGPRKQFLDIDWWMFRFRPINAKSVADRNVERKAKELADLIHCQSAKGRAEWSESFERWCEATKDEKFQAFKALIPGLVLTRRNVTPRTPNNLNQSQGAVSRERLAK